MRLIDADALKQDLLRRSFYPAIVSTALKNAPTIDPYEWISTKDRLPECEHGAETEALLFRLKTGTVIAGYFGLGGIWRDKYFRHYWDNREGWDAADVTHWMPLPKAPATKQ